MKPGSTQPGASPEAVSRKRRFGVRSFAQRYSFARRYSRFLALTFLVLGMAVRALTPAGYMPGSLADGTPFVLCPGGTPGARWFLGQGTGHAAHHHGHAAGGDESSDASWEYCPFGAAFAVAVASSEAALPGEFHGTTEIATTPVFPLHSREPAVVRARGPPVLAS
jgi:hypothetical protein